MDPTATQDADPTAHDPATAALLRGLNQHQRQAVLSAASPLRILAGAGSGKTRVLTHRIAHRAAIGTLDPNRVLAVTFTRKAAGELRDRLGRLGLRGGIHAGTFHSIAYAQLRQRWEERGVRPPELLERKVGFISRLMGAGRNSTAPFDVVAEIEWAAARRVTPETYAAQAALARRRPPLELGKVAEIYDRFMTEKRKRRLVDFDDLLRLAARDLAADPVYASARHWRFRHLFVDEFQDVNPLQYALLTAWLGPESDLCVVGDPNQAIYAWNGADAQYLVDFDRWFPGGDTVTLEDNYRSTPQVLTVANAVLAAGHNVPIRLRPHRPEGPMPTVTEHADEQAEAHAIARQLRDRHAPGRRGRHRRCWSAPTRRPTSSPRPSPSRASPTVCEGAATCWSNPRCARRWGRCGGPPRCRWHSATSRPRCSAWPQRRTTPPIPRQGVRPTGRSRRRCRAARRSSPRSGPPT